MSYLSRRILPAAALLALVALPAHGEDSRIERAKKIRDQILAKRALPAQVDHQSSRQPLHEDAREEPFADALEAARTRLAGIDAELETNRRKSEGLSAPREKLAARGDELAAMAARLEEQSRRRAEAIYRSARLGSQAAGWGAGEASSARLSRYLAAIAGAEQQNLAKIEVERGSIVASLDRIRADEATVVAERRTLEADRGEAEAAVTRATEDTEVRPDAEVAAIAARDRAEAPREEEEGDSAEADNVEADATASDVENLKANVRADGAGSTPLRNGGTLASENRALNEAAALMRLEEARAKLAARSRDEHIAQDKAGMAAAGSKMPGMQTPGAQTPEDFSWPGTGHTTGVPSAAAGASSVAAAPVGAASNAAGRPPSESASDAKPGAAATASANASAPAPLPVTPAPPPGKTVSPAGKPASPAAATQAPPVETVSAAKPPSTDAKLSEAKPPPAAAPARTPPPTAVAAVPAPASSEGDKTAAAPVAGEPAAGEPSAAPPAPTDASAPAKPRGFLSRLFSGAGDRESDKFAASRGALAPPVAGKVVANYGQQHKSGATYRGVVLRAAHNAPIRAVADGKVSFVGDVPGMGKTVIVSHGNRYHTVYARLGSVDVKEGEKVSSGTEVGALPDNDADMQFELRDQGTAVDPLPWLRGAAPGIAR